MDCFVADVHRLTSVRHPVFPADQSTYPSRSRIHRAQAGAIALRPDQLLSKSGAQLAVVIDDRAISVNGNDAVVEAAIAPPLRHTLIDSQREHDFMFFGMFAQPQHFRAFERHAVGGQASVELLRRRMVPTGIINCVIQPGGITGEEGLAEGRQLSALPRGFSDQRAGYSDSSAQIIVFGSGLNHGDAHGVGHILYSLARAGHACALPPSTARTRNCSPSLSGAFATTSSTGSAGPGFIGSHDIGQEAKRKTWGRYERYRVLPVFEK